MPRLKNTIKNAAYGWISNAISLVLGFVSRTVFIYILGTTYLGVNGLFTNVLSVLSFAELGIGTALNFSLYKPVAEKDHDKIRAYMNFYKLAYRVIALVVTVLGLLLLPLLPYIIKGGENVENIPFLYLIFLFNTVISYLVSYKFSLLNAEQKNYIYTNINLLFTIITIGAQLVTLLIFKNFIAYLLTAAGIGVIQKIFLSTYLDKWYPYLKDKHPPKLSKEELAAIKKNVCGLVFHKIGDVSIHQTDNILISSFINVTMVGYVSNYNLLLTSVSGFVSLIFHSAMSGLGNLVATESQDYQFAVFERYNFLNFWLYGFCSIALCMLSTPFVTLWIGADKTISSVAVLLIYVDFYFSGQRIAFLNFKTAYGVFYDDKYVALEAAVINLVISILMVKLVGLYGVYVGTVLSGLFQSIRRPIIAYRKMTGRSTTSYFKRFAAYALVVLFAGLITYFLSMYYLTTVTVMHFLIGCLLVAILPNAVFFILFRKTKEFQYFRKLLIHIRRK